MRALTVIGTTVVAVGAYKFVEPNGHAWGVAAAAAVCVFGAVVLRRFGLGGTPPSLWSDEDIEGHVRELGWLAYIVILLAASSAPRVIRLPAQIGGALACMGAYVLWLRARRTKAVRERDETFD